MFVFQVLHSPKSQRSGAVLHSVRHELATIFSNKNPESVNSAKSSLEKIGQRAIYEILKVSRTASDKELEVLGEVLGELGKGYVKVIEGRLSSLNENERWVAAVALGNLYSDEQVRLKVGDINSSSPYKREAASIILSTRAKQEDFEAILKQLPRADDNQKQHLIGALGYIGHEPSRNKLVDLVTNGDPNTKLEALEALKNSYGWASLLELQKIAFTHKEREIRLVAINALQSRADEMGAGSSIHQTTIEFLKAFCAETNTGPRARKIGLELLARLSR